MFVYTAPLPSPPMQSSSPESHHSYCNYPLIEKPRYDLFFLPSVFEDHTTLWRSFQTLWMSCRNITVKPLPFPKLNIPRWLSDFLHVSPPSPIPFHSVGAGKCLMDHVNLYALSLRYGEVAWELSVLRGTSERSQWGQVMGCCRCPWRIHSAWAVCELRTAYV